MSRMIRDCVEVGDHLSLDEMIARLTAIRDSLPASAEAEIKLRGDDNFGRHLCVKFRRPLTAEEADAESRYGAKRFKLRAAA